MSDYLPEILASKWPGGLINFLETTSNLWRAGRPPKRLLPFTQLDADSGLDKMTPKRDLRILVNEGTVVFAHFARAFFPAYIPGSQTHYGSVVYFTDPEECDHLFDLAWMVNELRKDNLPPPRGTEMVANAIRNDRSEFARIDLGRLGSGAAYFANICIHRTRLPLGYLHTRLVPVLIAPEKTESCTLLPLRFWCPEFKEIWSNGPPAYDRKSFEAQCRQLRITP